MEEKCVTTTATLIISKVTEYTHSYTLTAWMLPSSSSFNQSASQNACKRQTKNSFSRDW